LADHSSDTQKRACGHSLGNSALTALGSSKAQFRKAMYFATPLSGGVQHISNPAPLPLG
jgi:hypothetical protein